MDELKDMAAEELRETPAEVPEEAAASAEETGERKPEQSPEERARQAAGRRLRRREEAARSAARAEIEETLRRRGVVDPRTGRPVERLSDLEEEGEEEIRTPTRDPRIVAELEEIRRMDPEMEDLGCILRSENGERFRRYVRRGLSFVEAYTLAARERLESRSRERARLQAASKEHLRATGSRGDGGLSVPAEELALFRELLPEAGDGEIRRYYNADRRRFGR